MELSGLWNDAKDELEIAYRELIALVIASIESLVVLAIAVFIARRLRRRVRSTLNRTPLGVNLIALMANAASIGVYLLATTFVLALFGVNWTALLTLLSVSTLAISLALQDVLKNFVAGVYLLLERPFVIGDRIVVKDVAGEVEGIGIRTTMLRDLNEERIVVPNATILPRSSPTAPLTASPERPSPSRMSTEVWRALPPTSESPLPASPTSASRRPASRSRESTTTGPTWTSASGTIQRSMSRLMS